MAELKLPKKIVDEALNNVMNQVRSDTGMTLKECYEKQIPQMIDYSPSYKYYGEYCPKCRNKLIGYEGMKHGYCKYCGQRIKRC